MDTKNTTPKKPITIYITSEFMGNVLKYEGNLIDFGTKKYAQYDNAPFVTFVPKRKSLATGFVKGYSPYIIILKGHNHPEPGSFFKAPVKTEYGVTIRESKYECFNDNYRTDFDKVIESYLETNKESILMDIRSTVNTNIVNK